MEFDSFITFISRSDTYKASECTWHGLHVSAEYRIRRHPPVLIYNRQMSSIQINSPIEYMETYIQEIIRGRKTIKSKLPKFSFAKPRSPSATTQDLSMSYFSGKNNHNILNVG